jgi:hypothetical protein
MKTVNVMVMVQMDINPERVLADVVTGLDSINGLLQRNQEDCFNAQIFVSDVSNSDITNVTPDFEIGDEVEVPDPNDSDIHNHSFVGSIVGFRGELATVEDMDGDCFDIEVERLTYPD